MWARVPSSKIGRDLPGAALEETSQLFRALRQAREGCDDVLVRVHNCVERDRDGAEPFLFELLVRLRYSVSPVGEQVYQNEVLHQSADLGARKHIRFHPVTVGARI